MASRAKALEEMLPRTLMATMAATLYQRIMHPTDTTEVEPDEGILAVTDVAIALEMASESEAIPTTVPELAKQMRDTYCDIAGVQTVGDEKAWRAIARFLHAAVQFQEEAEAAAAFEIILQHELEPANAG